MSGLVITGIVIASVITGAGLAACPWEYSKTAEFLRKLKRGEKK